MARQSHKRPGPALHRSLAAGLALSRARGVADVEREPGLENCARGPLIQWKQPFAAHDVGTGQVPAPVAGTFGNTQIHGFLRQPSLGSSGQAFLQLTHVFRDIHRGCQLIDGQKIAINLETPLLDGDSLPEQSQKTSGMEHR
jgi:hypothetical protein